MKSYLFTLCALTTTALTATATAPARADWVIPNPQTAVAPGAQDAPASDPRTFPDEAAFQQRGQTILQGLASNNLEKWRTGYFVGGDPGKYLPGPAMAKLMLDPANEEARRYMNDARSSKEHYHFAAVNWGRFLPIFADALTPETQKKLADTAAGYSAYLNPGGTENHKVMEWSTANVIPYYMVGSGSLSRKPKDVAVAQSKEQLRQYVKGLYAAGQGEWDSSTYLMFDVNGLLNVYDFSPDPESRLIAKAGLDWLVSGFALKWRDGIYTAPNQRGFYDEPMESISSQTGWLWWGSNKTLAPEDTRNFLYTMHALTSSYRPNAVIMALAQKQNLAPFEARDTKPNYWHGMGLKPTAGLYHETVWNGNGYTLGSIWDTYGGQTTRMQLVASSPAGGVAFTGGNPRKSDHTSKLLNEVSYGDGNGRYDQSAQLRGTYISMSQIPADERLDYSFFSMPEAATAPVQRGKWMVMRVGETFLGLYSLGGAAQIGETELNDVQKTANEKSVAKGEAPKFKTSPILRFPGRSTGFILQTMSARDNYFTQLHKTAKPNARPTTEDDFNAFAALLAKADVDVSRYASDGELTYRAVDGEAVDGGVGLNGTLIRMKYQPKSNRAEVSFDSQSQKPGETIWPVFGNRSDVSFNGQKLDLESWPVYGSRYLSSRDSVLTVNDGTQAFSVDFTGDLPVYSTPTAQKMAAK